MASSSRNLPETLAQLERLRRTATRVAMATLVTTEGTTPRKEGAKMWVGADRRILGSVTIGGCVDTQVVAKSDEVIASGHACLLSLSLRDEEGWDLGLTCGGTIRVLVEPVAFDGSPDSVVAAYDAVRAEWERGRRAVIVVPLGGNLTRVVVRQDGSTSGSTGDTAFDSAVRAAAVEVLHTQTPRTRSISAHGVSVDCFFEPHGAGPRLLVFGATHVAIPLVRMAAILGWPSTVIDSRERFATRDRFGDADDVIVGGVEELASAQQYDADTYVVIVTHDYKFELPILRAVLPRKPAYVGLLASRGRARALREYLLADDVPTEMLDRVHVPIGLDIGAHSAAEIALSIMGEVVAVRATALSGLDGPPHRRLISDSGQ